jgi:hypothetical protein
VAETVGVVETGAVEVGSDEVLLGQAEFSVRKSIPVFP